MYRPNPLRWALSNVVVVLVLYPTLASVLREHWSANSAAWGVAAAAMGAWALIMGGAAYFIYSGPRPSAWKWFIAILGGAVGGLVISPGEPGFWLQFHGTLSMALTVGIAFSWPFVLGALLVLDPRYRNPPDQG